MKAIILLGAPGAGKGTIAEKIRDACSLTHVSTGDMLRTAVKNGTETGRKAEAYMKRGELVPDEIIAGIIEERFDSGTGKEAYLFDGFPRTDVQADLMEKSLKARNARVDRVFLLETPRDVILQRLTGRRVCRKCGWTCHATNLPPKQTGICNLCGGELYQRADDSEATILNRLDVYRKQTESLIVRYEKQQVLVRVDSNRDARLAADEMTAVLERDFKPGR
jgi:adenylate kinase